ncbi:MAG TPA: RNA polymerase sigma-70 factor [Dysgonamonadaceae bacterium]|nr:RNA polymerase sigma-70 factor [Dysgonamonadaceae bacterium]
MKEDLRYDRLFSKAALLDSEEALEELFFEFFPTLCVYASNIVGDNETARDIVQEVFFNIWKNRKKIELESSFRNFIVTAVRNQCTDILRKRTVIDRFATRSPSTMEPSEQSPEEIYTINELEQIIGKAIQKLPPNIREAFEMNRFKGMTYNEIAQHMSLSPKTIEAYISKALSILRVELKDYLPLFFLIF